MLTRRGTCVVGVVFLVLSFWQAPGRVAPDTKLDLTADPIGFLARATALWSPTMPMGQIQNQAYGYLFPHGAFFAVGDLLHLPPWVIQRLWWAVLLTAGFIGVVRLAEALRIGSPCSRLIAAAMFVAAPRVVTTLGTISSETLPMMLAPWVLLPVVRALEDRRRSSSGTTGRPLWQEAARSACAVALMGAVNAVATVAAVSVAVLWWIAATVPRSGRRTGLVFGGWWALGLAAASLWWIIPLLMLSRVSPPFLDFIESAQVTTEWTSLTEVLRGTSSWTPFVSAERAAGAVLVSQTAAVIATGVLAAAGLAGLTMRAMPDRGRWLAILCTGLLALCLGYPGALGSPIAETVRTFLDGGGAALRNVHKFDPLIRLPLALGVAHLLARVPVRSLLAKPSASNGWGRPAAALMVVVVAVFGSGSLAWTGGLAPASSYRAIPDYWQQTADWLDSHAAGVRTLVVPGAPFADQVWGLTRDEPLQALGSTPWAVRDAIPLTPPGAIRAMDSVQRTLTSGRGSTALADTLTAQGVGFIVLRADLDPATSRSARPLVVADALRRSPGITVAARFGPDVAPPTIDGIVVDDGLRPPMPAITVYRVGDARGTGPLLTPLDRIPRVTGGSESLAAINEARTRDGRPALGTALLSSDARRAGVGDGPGLIVTDTPADRETDFGRVDDHSSAIRGVDDPRLTKNAAADYPVDGASLVHGQWLLNNTPDRVRVSSSGSAADATQPGRTSPASSAAAAFDGDTRTAWVSRGLESAVGRWLAIEFTEAHRNLALTVTTAKALGPDVTSLLVTTDAGSTVVSGVTPGEPTRIVAPAGPTKRVEIRAIRTSDGGGGNQFAVADVRVADAGTGLGYSIRHRVVLPSLDAADRVNEWVLSSELGSRSECTSVGERVRCAPALGLDPESPGVFGRALSVPSATDVTPTVILRPRPGGTLTDLLEVPGQIRAEGASSVTDPRGTAAAAVDGDPTTVWTAPEAPAPADKAKDKKKTTKPHLVLRLPEPRTVSSLRISGPGDYPATPTSVTVDLGTGPQRVSIGRDGTVPLTPARTDRITVTVTKTTDLIDVNDLGFARQSPPGIAEIAVLPGTGSAVPDVDRPIEIGCGTDPAGPLGMGLSAGGEVHRLQVSTTARALRDGEPIVATPCPGPGVHLAAGEQEVSVNPGDAFTVDSVNLRAGPDAVGVSTPAETGRWDATDREVEVGAADTVRVLSVPESTNPGWHARLGGVELTPIVVNGWQQGWLLPAGAAGTVLLTFDLDTPYRWTLLLGLLLVAALFITASARRFRSPLLVEPDGAPAKSESKRPHPNETRAEASPLPVEPIEARMETSPLLVEPDGALAKSESKRQHPARIPATLAVALIAAYLLTGPWGAAAAVVAGLIAAAVTPPVRVVMTFSAMLIATVALATGPWNSGAVYAGYDALPQLAAIVAVSTAVTSAVLPSRRFSARRRGSSTKA
ncbi:alpha-(1-_3)-arabinofuranosyltransferase family protein [Gordonia sp. (in: high G+C Gram-positive bacteria)]|uniref:alpha-(1->3)-arabinofuranosyltransferase domain-containing protein n=1 Tax=Gordonia sp. (in: high G+C Gram-positive bacteria) TaxID=84139 RepID=UPI00333E9CC3